uniref:Uncharacterized protein n=1 Tax=Mucochytrium quahogii TaxID=96639 RepID=A0A7S2RT89_9STRA|mmetsp:Transcript_19741/g.42749  ORF Transcript_19741/g.42749 Transcript_19741/m.42749 type:complete len:451 (+) Transcript_19741:41-1393(+)
MQSVNVSNDAAAQLEALTKERDELEGRLQKLQISHDKKDADIRKVCAALAASENVNKVKDLEHQNSSLKKQVDSLKQALEITGQPVVDDGCAQQLALTQEKLSESERLVTQLQDQCKKLQVEANSRDVGDVQALKAQVEKQAGELEKQGEKLKAASRRRAQAQSQLASCQEELKEKSNQLESLVDKNSRLETEFKAVSETLRHSEQELNQIRTDHSQMTSDFKKLEETHTLDSKKLAGVEAELKKSRASGQVLEQENSNLKTELDKAKAEIEDTVVEHRIASKRSVQLIKELKSQLSKECNVGVELKEKFEEADARANAALKDCMSFKDEIRALRQQLEEERQNNSAVGPFSAGLSMMRRRSSVSMPNTSPTFSEDGGVKLALAKRLESLLNENGVLKEKVAFLESSIHQYVLDIEQMKRQGRRQLLQRRQRPEPRSKTNAGDDDTEVSL